LLQHDGSWWSRQSAAGFSLLSCVCYAGIYLLVPVYRQMLETQNRELPIFNRIVLNISQPFIIVFVLISIALLILFYLKVKQNGRRYSTLLVLIIVNFLVAAVLLGMMLAEIL